MLAVEPLPFSGLSAEVDSLASPETSRQPVELVLGQECCLTWMFELLNQVVVVAPAVVGALAPFVPSQELLMRQLISGLYLVGLQLLELLHCLVFPAPHRYLEYPN